MNAVAGNYIIQTVSRALDLLEQFQEDEAELGINDLSNRLHLQKNNVFRLIATLKAKNYIEMNNTTGKYRLGLKSRALGHVATRQIDFADHAHRLLGELKKQCNETCYFSVIKDGYTYYVDGVESDLPVRVAQRIGSSRPLHCTAAGRVQLAFMEPQKQMELLSGAVVRKPAAGIITDAAALQSELHQVAQKGYAIDEQEYDAEVMEIAAPVFDINGIIIGAFSILCPKMRLAGTRLESELIPLVSRIASRLSSVLGYCQNSEALTETCQQTAMPKRTPLKYRRKRVSAADK